MSAVAQCSLALFGLRSTAEFDQNSDIVAVISTAWRAGHGSRYAARSRPEHSHEFHSSRETLRVTLPKTLVQRIIDHSATAVIT